MRSSAIRLAGLGSLAFALLCAGSLDRPDVDESALEEHIDQLRQQALEDLVAKQARVARVGYRLAVGGAPLCGEKVAPLLGAAIARRYDLVQTHAHEEETEQALGLADEVKVVAIVEGSPADRGGLRVGDLILAVDGDSTPKTTQVFQGLRSSEAGEPTLRIGREGSQFDATLPRVEGCSHGVLVQVASEASAQPHDDRQDIVVLTGLVRFVRDDDELAIAIAHQMAHELLGTTLPRHGSDEAAADRLGLFIAARAGFDVSKAPGWWDRLAAEEPWRVHSDVSWGPGGRYRLWHTALALRAPVIRATVEQIQGLRAAGAPLDP